MQDYLRSLRKQGQIATAHIVAANKAFDRVNAKVRKANIATVREIKRLNRIHSLIR